MALASGSDNEHGRAVDASAGDAVGGSNDGSERKELVSS
jgi:hypothetical protein